MKRLFSLAIALGGLLALAATQANAAPAVPASRTFTQPDGTVITGTLHGDEWFSWYRTSDGRLFIRNPQTGAYEYAALGEQNGQRTLVTTNQRVGSSFAPSVSAAEAVSDETLYEIGANERVKAGVKHEGVHAHTLSAPHAPGFSATAMGPRSFKTLIVMVEFSDAQITSPTSAWGAKIFGTAEGQLNHYFDQNSYGKARFEPATETEGTANDGFVRVRLNYPHPDSRRDFAAARVFLSEALTLTDAWVDFSTYDTNSDGRVSGSELQVGFMVAGGEASHGDVKSIWGHSAYLEPADPVVLDGVRVASENGSAYFAWGERHGDHDATVGIIAHEIGHSAFDLPDLYPNLDDWDLMSTGGWGRKSNESWSGQTPAAMSAHTRWKAGFIDATWVDPMYVVTTHSLHRALSATPNLVVTTLPIATGGYFALEHRRIEGYDLGLTSRGVPAGPSGVLVLAQTNSAFGLDLVRAGTSGITSHLFYPGNNDRLAPDTTPNTHHSVDGTVTGIIFSNIAHSGDAMSVRIGRAPTTPGADCRLFTASLSAHATAGRAYTVTTGTWWKTTTYHAVGSGESLGTLASTQVTLKETPAGHFSRGTSCPDQNAPVFSEVQVTPDGPRARIGGR
ncbi:MAG: M6 family metalloprotease domain-containing protein, partial [Myxococcaceae bacterium]